MQAAVLDLYDPDRSRRPLRRTTPEGPLGDASWEEFIEFWQQRREAFDAADGAGLAVLSAGHASPTASRLERSFRHRFPRAEWVYWEPLGEDHLFAGVRLASGLDLRPRFDLAAATVIVSLESDFLLTESDAIHQARGFARSRVVRGRRDGMSRLYVAESDLSLTGAAADHRLALRGRQIGRFAALLAWHLEQQGVPIGIDAADERPPSAPALEHRAELVARDLLAAGEAGLVIAGRSQPPEVHALTLAINRALGAVGRTVTLRSVDDLGYSGIAELRGLVRRLQAGEVETLITLGGQPAYSAPADFDLPAAIGRAGEVIHCGTHVDETATQADWHLPLSHFLESWGDARAGDGSPAIVQPLIAPLFESRSAIELTALLVRGRERSGHTLVTRTWLDDLLGGSGFERRWERALHDGVLGDAASQAAELEIDAAAVAVAWRSLVERTAAARPGLEAVFRPSAAVYDGRFANNGWLQELPDPVTRMVWGNAALIGPSTAARLGVVSGQTVELALAGGRVEAPIQVLPGVADDCVVLPVGYGRRAAGRVGDGIGFDAYRLRSSDALYHEVGLRLMVTGKRSQPVLTQTHWSMEGRDLVREASLEEYRRDPGFATAEEADEEASSLWPQPAADSGPQWGMTIDLNACIGCNACVVACQSENNIPVVGREQVSRGREMHWLRVDRYFSGAADEPAVVFQPIPCMHCENAPCEEVCPVGATVHDRQGLNAMVYNRCIGTRYCSNNCPYKVRRFNFFNYTRETPELVKMAMNPDVTVRSRGVMEKCSFCVQRIREQELAAKMAGAELEDGAVRPACQQTCPAAAIEFGDISAATSRVSAAKESERNYTLLSELHLRPRTSYLAGLRHPHRDWRAAAEADRAAAPRRPHGAGS